MRARAPKGLLQRSPIRLFVSSSNNRKPTHFAPKFPSAPLKPLFLVEPRCCYLCLLEAACAVPACLFVFRVFPDSSHPAVFVPFPSLSSFLLARPLVPPAIAKKATKLTELGVSRKTAPGSARFWDSQNRISEPEWILRSCKEESQYFPTWSICVVKRGGFITRRIRRRKGKRERERQREIERQKGKKNSLALLRFALRPVA